MWTKRDRNDNQTQGDRDSGGRSQAHVQWLGAVTWNLNTIGFNAIVIILNFYFKKLKKTNEH